MSILASIISTFGANIVPPHFSPPRHQAPPRPRFGSVKRHRRHAAKQRARRRAKSILT